MIKVCGIKLLSYEDAANQMHVNRQTVARMVKKKRITAVRMGRYMFIPYNSLQSYAKGSNNN